MVTTTTTTNNHKDLRIVEENMTNKTIQYQRYIPSSNPPQKVITTSTTITTPKPKIYHREVLKNIENIPPIQRNAGAMIITSKEGVTSRVVHPSNIVVQKTSQVINTDITPQKITHITR